MPKTYRTIKNFSSSASEINPIVYVVLFCILGVLQYIFFIKLQSAVVDLLYFLILLSFLLTTIVNGSILLLLLQQIGIVKSTLLFGDTFLWWIQGIAVLNVLLFLGFLCWQIPLLPGNIPIHYSLRKAVDVLGNPENLLFYFYLMLGIVVINFILSNFIFKTNKLAAYLIATTSLLSELFIALVVYANFLMSHMF